MEKSTDGKSSGTRIPFHAQQPRLTFSSVKDTLDTCSPSLHLATSAVEYISICMHMLGKIELGKAIKKCKSCGYIVAICQSSV